MSQTPFADLSGRHAVVTGASSGIGRAIARELAAAGAEVLVHFAHSEREAQIQDMVRELQQSGTTAAAIQWLFGPDTNYEQFAERCLTQCPSLDIWVNNAGADLLTGEGCRQSYLEKLRQLWDVDVTSTILLTRIIGRHFKSRGKGAIINIGWDQADRGMEGDSAELFSAAKNAIMGATRSFAVSLAPEVRVNCIAPGWIQTAWGAHASAAWQERVMRETPLRRWGTPEDIAKLTRFLVSDEASYLTGQVINANGGAVR